MRTNRTLELTKFNQFGVMSLTYGTRTDHSFDMF